MINNNRNENPTDKDNFIVIDQYYEDSKRWLDEKLEEGKRLLEKLICDVQRRK